MKDYAECVAYLFDLGFPIDFCERVCQKYENKNDLKGLVDYILVCEAMVDSCIE